LACWFIVWFYFWFNIACSYLWGYCFMWNVILYSPVIWLFVAWIVVRGLLFVVHCSMWNFVGILSVVHFDYFLMTGFWWENENQKIDYYFTVNVRLGLFVLGSGFGDLRLGDVVSVLCSWENSKSKNGFFGIIVNGKFLERVNVQFWLVYFHSKNKKECSGINISTRQLSFDYWM
jgi:hypothetical protein